ncbi:MAG: S9 family peptidase [Marinomonas sp.]
MKTRFLTALPVAALFAASPLLADGHAAPAGASADTEHSASDHAPMSAADLVTMPRLGSPIVSPDGTRAIYRITETDPKTLERSSKYYVIDLGDDSAPAKQLTFEMEDAHSLQWGKFNTLYFMASLREETQSDTLAGTQIFAAELLPGGSVTNTVLISALKNAPEGFTVAPKEDKVAVWANLPRSCEDLNCNVPAADPDGPSGRLYEGDAGFVRHWDHWKVPGQFNRVFVYDIKGDIMHGPGVPADGKDPETGITANTPTMPFGGGEDVAFAPDSSGLYFTARIADAAEPASTDLDIYWSDLSGAAPTELTAANTAHDSSPTPSPDGKYLAYLAMERAGYESDKMTIMLRHVKSGKTRALTKDFDRSFGSIAWSANGKSLIATAADTLDIPAFQVDAKTGQVTKLDLIAGYEAHIGNVVPLADGGMLFTRDSIGTPKELYIARSGEQARPLTDAATSRVGNLASTVTTRFSFPGAGGEEVWGQITKLENFKGFMPAILYIHGGPQGTFNDSWSSRWNPRVLASQGYAVISVDFHGSAGYGQAFTDSINQDWGGKPLEDLQKGLAAALALDKQIDGGRACAMGASYGGYMVNWIAGKWPSRFSCLIQHDGLFDMRSFYYATEELWFPRWDFGGSYTDVPENYEKWNPANHVDQWRTPMLVVTGEKDFRVPYTQGVQSFTVLQERGIPSQLLVFPDENHWVLGAKNSLQWHDTVFNWLDRWLKAEANVVTDPAPLGE